jgi:hypothetical protein
MRAKKAQIRGSLISNEHLIKSISEIISKGIQLIATRRFILSLNETFQSLVFKLKIL